MGSESKHMRDLYSSGGGGSESKHMGELYSSGGGCVGGAGGFLRVSESQRSDVVNITFGSNTALSTSGVPLSGGLISIQSLRGLEAERAPPSVAARNGEASLLTSFPLLTPPPPSVTMMPATPVSSAAVVTAAGAAAAGEREGGREALAAGAVQLACLHEAPDAQPAAAAGGAAGAAAAGAGAAGAAGMGGAEVAVAGDGRPACCGCCVM